MKIKVKYIKTSVIQKKWWPGERLQQINVYIKKVMEKCQINDLRICLKKLAK